MREIKVFLASSTKFIYDKENLSEGSSAKKLKNVIEEIIRKNSANKKVIVKIIPWWTCFKEAGTFMSALLNVIHESEIGIFMLGKDQNIKNEYKPNPNVIIEYGMFTALNKIAYLIKESDKVKLPSDMYGLNANSLERQDEVVTGFIQTLNDYIGKPNSVQKTYGNVCAYYDVDLSNKFIVFNSGNNDELRDWESKSLYIGTKSAGLWQKIEENKYYREYLAIKSFITDYKGTIENLPINNVISFGPGIGKIDQEIMSCLRDKVYIPIDLNISLAIKSARTISENLGCRVPFAVVDDFENAACYTQLSNLIESKRLEIGKNNLFSLVGVTFSNLSMNCEDFFQYMQGLMKDEKDYLFIDAIIYNKESDSVLKNNLRKQMKKYYLQLISNAIKKKGLFKPSPSKDCLTIEDFEFSFIKPSDVDEYQSRVSIPNTKVICVKYQDNIVLIAKHYKYDDIKTFISERFEIVESKSYDERKRGIFLLKKKQ